MLKRSKTALLVLADENDRVAYTRWLRAQGVVNRSMDGPALVDAMRRVARGELFVQKRSSDMRKDPSDGARERTESRNRTPVVLSVDENSAILYERYKILQGAGYGVLSATDVEQALSMFEAYPVDLVLLDHAMHGTAGEIVAHKIKQCKQNIPVIAVSASPITDETLTCADCVVTKGEGPVLLLKKIGQLLAPLSAVGRGTRMTTPETVPWKEKETGPLRRGNEPDGLAPIRGTTTTAPGVSARKRSDSSAATDQIYDQDHDGNH